MEANTGARNEGIIIRRLYRSSVVSIIIAAVAAMFGMLIDGVMISRFLGTDSMAAYGIVSPLFSLMTMISGVLAAGSQVYCARHLGAGEVERARKVFSVCMMVTVAVSLILIAVAFLFCRPICSGLGASGATAKLLPEASMYLYGIAPGILPVLLLFIFNSLMRLDGDPNRVVAAVVVMTVFDIAGDFLNVFVFKAGMLGMGISTTVSYYAALTVLLFHFRKPDIILRFTMKGLSWKELTGMLSTGAPTAVGSASTMVRTMILNRIMAGAAGSAAVAALSVRTTLNTLFGSILLGVGMTTTMIAGMVYGEEDRTSAGYLMKVSLKYAVCIGAALAVGIFCFAPNLVTLFAGKGEAEAMAAYGIRGMRIYAFGLPMYGINMVFVNYLQGINRGRLANLVSVLDNLVFVCAIAYAFVPILNTDAVWLSYPLGEALVILFVLLMAARRKKGAPKSVEDLLFLSDSFGVPDGDIYERSIHTVDEVMESTVHLEAFMEEHKATPKQKMLIPLCVEEMVKNVVEHGFTKDERPHSVELRVLRKDDEWIIRIRDNCQAFDPKKWMEIHHPEDPASNIGIRMVYGMARSVQYVNAMQLNNLIIRV